MTIAALPQSAARNSELQEIDMLNRKSLIIAAVAAATVGGTALSSQAHANDDALLGAVVGAGIGAAIGHNVHGRDGAVVGGAIGAIAGASIAASSPSYYNTGYYDNTGYYAAPATVYGPAPVYYGAAPAYYQAAPVYYPRRWVDYGHYYGPRYVDHGRSYDRGHPDWRGNDGHHRH
jgi:YmgG-like glycine-zipper protein